MKITFRVFLAGVIVLTVALIASAQVDLQKKLSDLVIGKSKVDEISSKFGKPDSVGKLSSWTVAYSLSPRFDTYYLSAETEDKAERHINRYVYSKLGITFLLFDAPSELYSYLVTDPALVIQAVKVGSPLELVEEKFGKQGEWTSTNARDDFVVEYRTAGLRFTFDRDPKFPKYPMKLKEKPTVTSIEVFNSRVGFGSSSKDR